MAWNGMEWHGMEWAQPEQIQSWVFTKMVQFFVSVFKYLLM